jgi:hypothetical protein
MTHIASSILVVGLLLLAHVIWHDVKHRREGLLAAKRAARSAGGFSLPPR